jgi:hypothetical protein
MSIIKSVLFVWPLVPLIFLYSYFSFVFVSNVLIYILPIALELAESSLKLLANLASAFSKVAGTLPVVFLKSLENGCIPVDLDATLEKALANGLTSLEKSAVFLQQL